MARINYVKRFRGTTKTSDGTLSCNKCGKKIEKGDPYRWWANRTPGSFGSYRRIRCMESSCSPMPWEYQTTSPHIAALMMADHQGNEALDKIDLGMEPDDFVQAVNEAVQDVANGVREAAEGYREAADSMESGFGHPTSMSEELTGKADQLEDQASNLEMWEADADPPEPPDEDDIEDADDDDADDPMEEYERELESWRDQVLDQARDAVTEGCEQAY